MRTAPAPLPAPPRCSGRERRRFKQKKLSPWPGASGPAPSPPAAARENNCSLLPRPAARLPAESSPARGAERAAAVAPPPRRPCRRRARLRPGPPSGASAGSGPARGGAAGRAVALWGSPRPASISGPLRGARRACRPLPARFLPTLSRAPGWPPASGAGTIAPVQARRPGRAAPDARAPRGCRRLGP